MKKLNSFILVLLLVFLAACATQTQNVDSITTTEMTDLETTTTEPSGHPGWGPCPEGTFDNFYRNRFRPIFYSFPHPYARLVA